LTAENNDVVFRVILSWLLDIVCNIYH